MADSIRNLWPANFKIDVQSPFAILSVQANLLGKVTRGILTATVETEEGTETVQHRLVVIAPAYGSYRHTLIVAIHNKDLPYPVKIRAQGIVNSVGAYPTAINDDDMMQYVERALTSADTNSVILSLISKSNEAKMNDAKSAEG